MKIRFKEKFKKELRRQTRLAIAAAIGFLIAFSWKDSILALTERVVQKITTITGLVQLSIATSIAITILGVVLILLSSRLLE